MKTKKFNEFLNESEEEKSPSRSELIKDLAYILDFGTYDLMNMYQIAELWDVDLWECWDNVKYAANEKQIGHFLTSDLISAGFHKAVDDFDWGDLDMDRVDLYGGSDYNGVAVLDVNVDGNHIQVNVDSPSSYQEALDVFEKIKPHIQERMIEWSPDDED